MVELEHDGIPIPAVCARMGSEELDQVPVLSTHGLRCTGRGAPSRTDRSVHQHRVAPRAVYVRSLGEPPDRPTQRSASYRAVRQIETERSSGGQRDEEVKVDLDFLHRAEGCAHA